MSSQLHELVSCWMAWGGIDERLAPRPDELEAGFGGTVEPCRPAADPRSIAGWEHRHGFRLPSALRAWLMLSNGLYRQGPLIHPITAIGPMVVFSRIIGLYIQPESWFELGNPNVETICIDLAYRWPGGGSPVFTSGDESTQSTPRIIARSFEEWLLELLRNGGREFWFEPGFASLGDPWQAHRRYTPQPALPHHLKNLVKPISSLMRDRLDDSEIARRLSASESDIEILVRHVQHGGPP